MTDTKLHSQRKPKDGVCVWGTGGGGCGGRKTKRKGRKRKKMMEKLTKYFPTKS